MCRYRYLGFRVLMKGGGAEVVGGGWWVVDLLYGMVWDTR